MVSKSVAWDQEKRPSHEKHASSIWLLCHWTSFTDLVTESQKYTETQSISPIFFFKFDKKTMEEARQEYGYVGMKL